MKKTICVISFVLVFTLFFHPLFALIEGRIEGVVKDKDTKQPIEGATVTLKIISESNLYELFDFEYITKKTGTFRFDIKPRKGIFYYIQCQKKEYVSLIPEYYFKYAKKEVYREVVKGFSVEEGQVKFVEVGIERGGALEGVIYGTDLKGESPLALVSGLIIRKTNPNKDFLSDTSRYIIEYIEADDKGYFAIDGLEPYDQYFLAMQPRGHFVSDIRSVIVTKGEKNYAKYNLDLTDQTGIEGYIRAKGKPIKSCSVYLEQVHPSNPALSLRRFMTKTSEEGFFFYKGLPPGTYKISIRGFDENQKYYSFDKLQNVEVVLNSTYKLNLDI